MYINSINQVRNIYSNVQNKSRHKSKNNNVNFQAGPNVAVLENKAKIMASLDIMSRNPKIKLPENEIEKKAILTFLTIHIPICIQINLVFQILFSVMMISI